MFRRIIDATLLKSSLYREVAANRRYTFEAIIIVIIIALITASNYVVNVTRPLISAFIAQMINSIVFAWLVWSIIAFGSGIILGGRGKMNGMLRSMGYANSPRFLAFFEFIPGVSVIALLAAWVLSIGAAIVAIRETMELTTIKAILACILGLLFYALTSWIISTLLVGNNEMMHLLFGI
jgi:hypothetical protein